MTGVRWRYMAPFLTAAALAIAGCGSSKPANPKLNSTTVTRNVLSAVETKSIQNKLTLTGAKHFSVSCPKTVFANKQLLCYVVADTGSRNLAVVVDPHGAIKSLRDADANVAVG